MTDNKSREDETAEQATLLGVGFGRCIYGFVPGGFSGDVVSFLKMGIEGCTEEGDGDFILGRFSAGVGVHHS